MKITTPKNVITNPWETLCVDCIGPYTLIGNKQVHSRISRSNYEQSQLEAGLKYRTSSIRTVARTRTVKGKLVYVKE